MLEELKSYLKPPIFPDDEDKTFTAGLLHVILWSLLAGICLYTFIATIFSFIPPHMLLIAWSYVLALGGLALALMVVMRRGRVRAAAVAVNVGLWIIMTAAAYFNGGVAAPAYSGYVVVIICTCLLVSWQGGLVATVASALTGAIFLLAADNHWLPEWLSTYSFGSVWSANVAYFFAATMLLALALRAIKRASQQTQREMSERLKTEGALRQSEQRFHAIFDSVNDAIFVQDLSDGRILDTNKTMCEMYGFTADEARRLSVEDLSAGYAPFTQQDALGWWQKAAQGEPQVFEWLAKDRTGRLFWVEVNMRRASIDAEDRLLVVVRDIDDRKRTEAALRREQAYYEAIVNATPVMLWLKDTENRILRFNPAAARIECLAAAEMAGTSAYDLYPREQAEAYYRDDQEVIRSSQPKLGIIEQYTAVGSGKAIWVEMGKVPVRDDQGNIVGVLACAIDITERKLAEERERRTSQGLRAVIEAAQELINCANLDTLYRRSVELAREKLGLERCGLYLLDDREEFILGTFGTDERGRTTDERAAHHSVQDHPEVFQLSERIWLPYERTFTYWKGDHDQSMGGTGWNVATPIRSHRRTIGVLYNDTGITHTPLDETQQDIVAVYCSLLGSLLELKHAEAELAHERDLLQVLMDNFPDTIYFKDTASRFTRINRAQARLLGVSAPEDAIGKMDADFFSGELSQLFSTEEQHLMSSGEPIIDRMEYNPTPDGRPRWLSASKIPLKDRTGQIIGLVGISRDITDRRLMEERLRESQARFGSAFEYAAVGMALVAPDHSIVQINQAFCRMLGYDPAEVVGQRFGRFTHPEDVTISAEYHRRLFVGEVETYQFEKRYLHHQGQTVWALLSVSAVRDAANQPQYAIAQIQDITERKQAEERERRTSQGLRAVIEMADELIGCADLDTFYRRAVELARAKLDVERCGLFTLDEQGWLRGTYGTDLRRQTTDERDAHFQPVNLEGFDAASNQLWTLNEAEQTYWDAARQQVVGKGWVGTTFIRTRDRVMGVLYNDTAITHAPADEAQQEVLAVYCSLLGSLIELRHAEEALRESESTMRALLEAIPDAILRFDAQGVFKDFIPAKNFAPMLPSSAFIGQPYSQVLPPEMAQQLVDNFQQVLETGESRLFEYALSIEGQAQYYESRLVRMAQGNVLGIVRDVTDRKVAELTLQQREAYLRSILDNFPYWIWLKDTTGRFLAVNKALANTYGYERGEDLVGKTDDDVTSHELAEQYRADDRRVMESRRQKLVEEIVIEQGVETWFETFKSPAFDAQGNVIGTAGFAHDVTARRQAEAAMRESEALFRYLADNAPAFIAMSDAQGLPTYLNRVWQEFRGTAACLPIDEWAEYVHPDDRRRYLHEVRSALQGQRKFTTEYRLRRIDGQYRWLLDTAVPRYTAGEQFAGFIDIAVDITDRKNAEEALRRSEGRLRLLADNMVDSISQVDAQQRLAYASPSVERVFGHSLRDLLGRSLYEFVHSEDTSRLYHHILMATELHTSSLRLEYRYRHAAGHYLWVESEVRLLYDERGDFAGAVFGSRDISARRQIEVEREQLITELEDKNAELERFTYTVSHDLKSPLITIRGFLGFLEKDAVTGNLDRLHADVARIAEATTRMQQLLDELLELSRIGRQMNPLEELSFEKIAREAVALVQGRIMARGVQVEIADNLPTVYGDRVRLVEVVQNLVDNAVKFMSEQPAPRLTIGALGMERSGMPILFVQDNGLGIAPEYHERIFGLFNKLDAKTEGTGVGLALVKRIIDLHGGHIWVESDGVGHGSTFYFTLPRPTPSRREA